jgi:hypothetical protein
MEKHFDLRGAGGDRIYALPLVKNLGGGIVHGIPQSQISFFKKQPYIIDAITKDHPKSMMLWGYSILGRYYKKFKVIRPKETLVETHFQVHKLPIPSIDEINNNMIPWLVADKLQNDIPIVVHRSPRYRNEVDWSFLKKFQGNIVCIGYKYETLPFIQQYKARWLKANTLEDLATIINSAKVYIGNQSMPLSIAVGLGKTRMIEECTNNNFPKNRRYSKKIYKAVKHYKAMGNPYPLANCTFGSKNEFIMSSDANRNYVIIKKLLSGDINTTYYDKLFL